MAKRFTDTEMWDKEWYMKLSCKEKCLVKVVRDKADLAGVWAPNWIIATMYVGEEVCEDDLLKIDNGSQFRKLNNGKIYCIGFVEFQYGELSEKSPVHRKVISILSQNNLINNYKEIGCQYPINRVKEEEQEKEVGKEKEQDTEMPMGYLMDKKFREINPKYPQRPSKDMPAIIEWANFISSQSGSSNTISYFTPDERTAVMEFWEKVANWYRDSGETNDLDYLQRFKLQKIYTEIKNGTAKKSNGGGYSSGGHNPAAVVIRPDKTFNTSL